MSVPPVVSVGLPVYNGANFLAEAIESVLSQSFGELELVVSDNASTDDTEAVARDYAERDRRVRYSRLAQNRGAAVNFNRTFLLSRGTFFKWLAADDLIAPTFLEQTVAVLRSQPGVALAYARNEWIDSKGAVLRNDDSIARTTRWPENPVARFQTFVHDFGRQGPRIGPVYVFGLMRSSAVRQTRLLGRYPSADINFLAELTLAGNFAEVPARLQMLRSHPESLSYEYMRDPDKVFQFWDPQMRGAAVKLASRARSLVELFVTIERAELSRRDKATLVAHTAVADLRAFYQRFLMALAPELPPPNP